MGEPPVQNESHTPLPILLIGSGTIGAAVGYLAAHTAFAASLLPIMLAGMLLLIGGKGTSVRSAALSGLCFGLGLFSVALSWLTSMFGAASITLFCICALYSLLSFACVRWIQERLNPAGFLKLLIFPIVWTGFEFLRSEIIWPDFTWMGLGYTTAGHALASAPAALIGIYGVTFLICLLSSGIALLWNRPGVHNKVISVVAAAVWVGLCMAQPRMLSHAEGLHVRLIQGPSEQDDDYLKETKVPVNAAQKLDVVVWPEDSFVSDPHRTPKLWPKLKKIAQDHNIWFLFGARDTLDDADLNGFKKAAYLLNPQGVLVGKHFKNHLVHFFREGVRTSDARGIRTPLGRLGVAICFDMDFPDVTRREAADGAELMLCPSDNPAEWGPLQHQEHRLLYQMRAIECGRWVASADTAGTTFLAGPDGRIYAEVTGPEVTHLDVTVPRRTNTTLFVRGGWLFGPINLGFLAVLLVAAKRKWRGKVQQPLDPVLHFPAP